MALRSSGGLFGGVAAMAIMAASAPAFAQAAPPPAGQDNAQDAGQVDGEIVVTAEKRSRRLQDVPLAVTALSGDALVSAQVNSAGGLAALVPSLTYTQNTSPLNNNVRVRGIGTVLFSAGIESSVSFVTDGVVMARQGQGFNDLIDVERVEVLRGPQGVLFGKNATAGVINVVTKAPSERFEGSADLTIAELGEYRLRGTVSGPLAEGIRGRLTGFYTKDNGWATNEVTGRRVFGTEDFGLRGKLAFDVSDNFELLLIGDYTKSDSSCCQPMPFLQTNDLLRQLRAPVVGSINNRSVNTTTSSFANVETGGVSLEGNLKLGEHRLTSITAWRTWDFVNNVDVDGFAVAQPVRVPFGFGFFGINGGTVGIRQFSQEVRLASPVGQFLEYTLGAMYFHLDLDRTFERRVGGCPTATTVTLGAVCPTPAFQSSSSVANTRTDNIAAFGQLQMNITDKLAAIGGFRLQNETTSYTGNRPGTAPFTGDTTILPGSTGAQSLSDVDLSGKLGVQYMFSRSAQIYASWSRGYKGIGWDVEFSANFASQAAVRPETVQSWEIGFKGQALDRRLNFSLAAFHARYTDLQVQATQQVNGAPISIPTNAGTSVTKGIELEASYRPTDSLSFFGGVTYMSARFDSDGLPCTLPTQAAAATVAAGTAPPVNSCFLLGTARVQNIRDGVLPNSPDWKANLTARYERPITAGLVGFVQATGAYQSRVLFDLSQDQALDQPGYGTIDLTIGLNSADNRYQLSLFVRNLTDTQFVNGKQRDNLLTNPANPNNINFFTAKSAFRYVGGNFRVNF